MSDIFDCTVVNVLFVGFFLSCNILFPFYHSNKITENVTVVSLKFTNQQTSYQCTVMIAQMNMNSGCFSTWN